MNRPLIGVTTSEVRRGSSTHPSAESDPPQPELALGMAYLRAVESAGGIPVVLSPLADPAAIDTLLRHLSGVCLSGGPDIDPCNYGAEAVAELGPTEPDLDLFELSVARRADALALPVLGVCRGAQTLNVARGGTLIQHLPAVTDGSVEHRQSTSGYLTSHPVDVAPGSRLASIVGREHLEVNSFHHQATERLGEGLRAVAWSSDGMVEGIEGDPDARGGLLLGVQWHAETLTEMPEHLALFEALVEAASSDRVARELVA
jgi:putative glutamine amidotransferase